MKNLKYLLNILVLFLILKSTIIAQPNRPDVDNLISTEWQQWKEVGFCPENVYEGCLAVAVGQVMKKWNYPSSGIGSINNFTVNCNNRDVITYNLQRPVSETIIDYGIMNDEYTEQSELEEEGFQEVQQFLILLGTLLESDYTSNSRSGTSAKLCGGNGCFDHNSRIERILELNFGYKLDAEVISKDLSYNNNEQGWQDMIYREIDEGRPVIMYGNAGDGLVGHFFIVDGYKNDQFHLNLGWGKVKNGYFDLDDIRIGYRLAKFFDVFLEHDYTENMHAVVGIEPAYTLPYSNILSENNGRTDGRNSGKKLKSIMCPILQKPIANSLAKTNKVDFEWSNSYADGYIVNASNNNSNEDYIEDYDVLGGFQGVDLRSSNFPKSSTIKVQINPYTIDSNGDMQITTCQTQLYNTPNHNCLLKLDYIQARRCSNNSNNYAINYSFEGNSGRGYTIQLINPENGEVVAEQYDVLPGTGTINAIDKNISGVLKIIDPLNEFCTESELLPKHLADIATVSTTCLTCSDNTKNGSEVGEDCGGNCNTNCVASNCPFPQVINVDAGPSPNTLRFDWSEVSGSLDYQLCLSFNGSTDAECFSTFSSNFTITPASSYNYFRMRTICEDGFGPWSPYEEIVLDLDITCDPGINIQAVEGVDIIITGRVFVENASTVRFDLCHSINDVFPFNAGYQCERQIFDDSGGFFEKNLGQLNEGDVVRWYVSISGPSCRTDRITTIGPPCLNQNFYLDQDGDGYGTGSPQFSCYQPPGYAPMNGDCDDTNANINDSATEVCDLIDNDCDGQVDENVKTTYYRDNDNDGYGSTVTLQACFEPNGYTNLSGDCNDNNANVYPGANEVCDGLDNNCAGGIDEGVKNTYYRDADNDGFGNPNNTTLSCSLPTGYVTNNSDCDDTDNTVNPNGTEICDNVDNNCAGGVDEGGVCTQNLGDNCSTAIQLITNGVYNANGPNAGFGASHDDHVNVEHADWYFFVPSQNGTVTLFSCDGGIDTRVFAYIGSCGNLSEIASGDDDCALSPQNPNPYASSFSVDVTCGEVYYFEWDDRWSESGFDFSFDFIPETACVATLIGKNEPVASFESGFDGFIQDSCDDLDWIRHTGPTLSDNTGPSDANDGNYYLYVEASGDGAGFPNKTAIITTPCYDLTGMNEPAFFIFFHIYGNDGGTIRFEYTLNQGQNWNSINASFTSDADIWRLYQIDLRGVIDSPPIAFRIIAETGSGWQSDIAIDEIGIRDFCPDFQELSGVYNFGLTAKAKTYIRSTTIIGGRTATMNAGDYIELIEGFEVKSGAELHAFIDGCDN